MHEILANILKIAFYFLIIFTTYFIALKFKNKKNRYPLIMICLICALTGVYAIICGKYPYVSDRLNFAFRYENDAYVDFVRNESFGLYVLESFLHLFSYDARFLFFSVAFLFMFITLIAYKKSKNSSPMSLLILLLSGYPIYGFYMLKQCIAMALIYLGYSFITQEKKYGGILCLICAITFHEAVLVLIPILIAIKISKNKKIRNVMLTILTAITILFERINAAIIKIFSIFLPSLGVQISGYLDKTGGLSKSGSGIAAALKGTPFYYLCFVGIKKDLHGQNTYNGGYIIITFFTAISFLLSNFMYWMFRFGLLFYAPISEYASLLYGDMKNNSKEIVTFKIFMLIIPFIFSLRLWCQYYFLYGGL